MVTTHKAESENEEIKYKVRARAMVTTDLGEGTAELGQQSAKLMAALTKVGQGNNPSSAPSSPQERGCGRGCNGSSTPSHPNSHNGRSGPGQTTPACSLPTGHGTGELEMEVMDRITKGLAQGGRAQPIGGTQILSNALGVRGRVTWPENALPQHWLYTSLGGTEGMWLTPYW